MGCMLGTIQLLAKLTKHYFAFWKQHTGRADGHFFMDDPPLSPYLYKFISHLSQFGGLDWIDLAQNRDRWRALVGAVMNLRVP
jgi:hypothetical protein